jgi:hypothetical protein
LRPQRAPAESPRATSKTTLELLIVRKISPILVALITFVVGTSAAFASTPGGDVRLTHDESAPPNYVSADDLAGLTHYTDATLDECSVSRGRQNEPALAINPRDNHVMVGSSNDYCAVYNDSEDDNGAPIPSGPIWLGYYRSENSGASFVSSLVPGYPGDTSQLGALSKAREASSGDPVLAWDADGRLFMGAEASDDPAGSFKTFGDVWVARYVNADGTGGDTLNDGQTYAGTTIVARGSAAPYLLGVFHDKTAIEADRTDSACRDNVYFAWSRFNGYGANAIYFARSTDHGVTFSQPVRLTSSVLSVQFPDISVTSNGHVYITYRQFGFAKQQDAIDVVKSTDCGATFSSPKVLDTIAPMGLVDIHTSGSTARDCGDGVDACQSGYTFWRADTGPRSTADQADTLHEWVYLVYEAIVPGTEVDTGTTFGWADEPGKGGQSAIYYLRYDGVTGDKTTPDRVATTSEGQQLFPDLAVDAGAIHALWYDSRNDEMNDASSFTVRPIGNDADGNIGAGFDVYASWRPVDSGAWSTAARLTDVTSNGQYEQFSGRTVPFGGDYLWIDSKSGLTFGVWTDWRNTVGGTDQRETTVDETGADVLQCRFDTTGDGDWSGDTCPRDGGLDQNIYGDLSP